MIRLLPMRLTIFFVAFTFAAVAGAGLASQSRAAGFTPGGVDVIGVGVTAKTVEFNPGSTVSLYEVLLKAAGLGAFDLKAVDAASVFNGKSGEKARNIRFSDEKLRGDSGSLPAFAFTETDTVMELPGGGSVKYCGTGEGCFVQNPKVTVELKKDQGTVLAVILKADLTTIKAGGTVRFTANAAGATKLSYSWSFGDGSKPAVGSQGESHKYTKPGSFTAKVTVTDQASGASRSSSLRVTVKKDKPKKKSEDPNRDKSDPPADNYTGGDDGGYYGGGYGDDGNYGGSGPANPAPASPATPEPKKKKPDPIVDDGLVPVRGELLDPSIPGQVIEPSTEQPGGSEATEPEADPKGFALSGGAKTALGIAALLGIGGLAEIGSFTRLR